MSLMMKRYSVRNFKKDKIKEEDITKMLTSAMQAPSAVNQQPWEFVVVDDRNQLDKLSEASKGAWMLKDAPLCITVIMKDSEQISGRMKPQDCAAAVENILLEAVNLGLGAVWIGVYPVPERMEHINNVLNITKGTAFANIAIGYPAKSKEVTIRYDESRVHRNKVQ